MKARKASGLSYASIAEAARLSGAAAVHFLEHGEHAPRIDTVEGLASALGVSPAWLAFGTTYPMEPAPDLSAAGIAQRLQVQRVALGLSVRALGRLSGTSDTTVRLTETESTVPTIAKVEALAKALEVSVGWLAYGVGHSQGLPLRVRRAEPDGADGSGR